MDQGDTVLIGILGGAALLLYGVRLIGDGLQRAAGAHLRPVLQSLSGSPLRALLVGAGVTGVLQSSSATTVMLVGFASAGLLTLRQTIGVILGADIGTTVTVQLLAFDLARVSPLIVFVGWLLSVAGRGAASYAGRAVLGFGFLFLGILLIQQSTAPLRSSALFTDLMTALVGQPIVLIVVSAVLTALVASSAAVIGIAISLATSGVMPLAGAIPVILGANVGTAGSALVASIGANVEARRVAVAHAGFKVIGVLLVLPFLGPFAALVSGTAPDIARQIANAHTIFNVVLALVFLPFAPVAADLFTRLIPDTPSEQEGAIYLNEQTLDAPAVALGQALRETLRMGDLALGSLRDTLRVFEHDDERLLREIHGRDDRIDRLDDDIKQFLTRLHEQALTPEQAERESELLFVVVDLEAIGDVIDKQLMELAEKKISGAQRFSERGWAEIADLHAKVAENLELSLSALATGDAEVAEKVLRHKSVISELERIYRRSHMDRLRAGLRESIDTSSIHLDVLLGLRQVNSFATAIAYAVLGKHLPPDIEPEHSRSPAGVAEHGAAEHDSGGRAAE